MARYIIWDKQSPVITPIGEVFTSQQWKDRYPVANIETLDLVIAGDSAINGAFCQEYSSFVSIYKNAGCDFTNCESKQDYLDVIEAFEDACNEAAANVVSDATRTADALEDLVVLQELAQS